MKKLLSVFYLIMSLFYATAFAGGGLTHMFIAQEIIPKIPDAKLRNLLNDNKDAYLVGAYYPDSGFVNGTSHGEDSHWDLFIDTFRDYLNEKYTDPVAQNPRLVAFLFGCAVHRLSDEIIHFTFYNYSSEYDFHGDWHKAHVYGDPGIDLLLIVDKGAIISPNVWWVPVSDLLQVYHRMGKDQYTAEEIIKGNRAIYLANHYEKFIAHPSYPYLKWKMWWTSWHYYNWPYGGILMDEEKVMEYQMKLWNKLTSKIGNNHATPHHQARFRRTYHEDGKSIALEIAERALDLIIVSVDVKHNDDGSVEVQQPMVNSIEKNALLIKEFLNKFIHL